MCRPRFTKRKWWAQTRLGKRWHASMIRKWWKEGHTIFKLMWLAVGGAALAAATADGDPPAAALGSEVLWRLEIAVAVLLVTYAIIMLMWLAHQGKWVNIPVPGANGGITPGDDIDTAATSLSEFKTDTKGRLDEHQKALEDIRNLLESQAKKEE